MNLNRNYFSSSDDDDVVLRRPYKRIRLMSDSDISNSGDVISFHRLQIGSGSETETAVETDTATLSAEEGDNYHYNILNRNVKEVIYCSRQNCQQKRHKMVVNCN